MRVLSLAILLLPFLIGTAAAQQQWNQDQAVKLERLERDIQVLQRQLYRQGGSGGGRVPDGNVPMVAGNSANAEVRMAQIEEQMRKLNGRIEELQFALQQANQQLPQRIQLLEDKLLKLEEQQTRAVTPATPAVATPTPATPPATPTPSTPPATPPSAEATTAKPDTVPAANATAQAEYHQAFQLLNQSKFAEARTALQQFTDKYPKDPLIGNAFYWLGETHYVERDYMKAADSFRKGYAASPEGQKAPDNLLKLGLSLAMVEKKTEACVVYNQLGKRFPNLAGATRQKLDQEKLRLSCGN